MKGDKVYQQSSKMYPNEKVIILLKEKCGGVLSTPTFSNDY
jgi:hypothetical protein